MFELNGRFSPHGEALMGIDYDVRRTLPIEVEGLKDRIDQFAWSIAESDSPHRETFDSFDETARFCATAFLSAGIRKGAVDPSTSCAVADYYGIPYDGIDRSGHPIILETTTLL